MRAGLSFFKRLEFLSIERKMGVISIPQRGSSRLVQEQRYYLPIISLGKHMDLLSVMRDMTHTTLLTPTMDQSSESTKAQLGEPMRFY